MIVTDDQPRLEQFLCNEVGYSPTNYMRCIGNVINGRLVAVVGYDNYNGASIMAHSHGVGNWLTRDFLKVMFHYPFEVCGVNVVIGMVPSGNTRAIHFNKHLGFRVALDLPGAHPDGSLLFMTMTREECRFLDRSSLHGKKEQATAYA